jgi:YHS domain-containing protein
MESLIYFLVVAGLFLFMMRFGCGAHVMGHGRHHGRSNHQGRDDRQNPPARATDPVCSMTVETASAKPSLYQGRVYYFCSTTCREKFEASPDTYARGPKGPSQMKEASHGAHD